MKENKIIIALIIIIILLLSVICNFIKKDYLNNEKLILKSMTDVEYENYITTLNKSHTDYANYIQTAKQKIADAINMYSNNSAKDEETIEELTTKISSLTNIPENTYFYESGTEGDSSTIIRYKKIGGEYYKCNEQGMVEDSITSMDVSSVTLIPYTSTTNENLSAGSAGYASGKFYLGDGSDIQKNVTDSGYSKIIYLGKNTTFNVSNYEGFENFTEENFIVMATNSSNNVSKTWYEASASTTVTKSYDKSTGVLNAYMTLNHSGYNKGNYDPDIVFNGSAKVSVGVYLVL